MLSLASPLSISEQYKFSWISYDFRRIRHSCTHLHSYPGVREVEHTKLDQKWINQTRLIGAVSEETLEQHRRKRLDLAVRCCITIN